MIHRPTLALAALLALASLVQVAPPAQASHYRFSRIELVTQPEQRALAEVDVRDTKVLLAWTATLSNRVWLARATGIDLDRLAQLAAQCDLLRVDSVGPSMVEALQKAGVMDSRALARETPAPLLVRLKEATRGTPLRYRLPEEDTLSWWIRSARRLRPVLDFTPELPAP